MRAVAAAVWLCCACNSLLGIHSLGTSDASGIDDAPPDAACTTTGCACTLSSQCASRVCVDGPGDTTGTGAGSCADPAMVAYVAAGGAGSTCTQTAPCGSVLTAIGTGRLLISLAGRVAEAVTLTKRISIYGDGSGATLSGFTGTVGNIVAITSTADLHDLTITNGGNGVAVSTGASATLVRCTITGNQGLGVQTASGGSLTIERSRISGNTGGGVDTDAATLTLTNNFIVSNGSPAVAVGGVAIGLDVGALVFDYDTVCSNVTRTNAAGVAGGVTCSNASTTVLENSIIAGNIGFAGGLPPNPDVFGCAQSGSMQGTYVGSDLVQFDFTSATDFHIGSASAALGQAILDGIRVDIDGDVRPQHVTPDQGADERVDGTTR